MSSRLYNLYLRLKGSPSARRYLHLVPLPLRRAIVGKLRSKSSEMKDLDNFNLDLESRNFADACTRLGDLKDRWSLRQKLQVGELNPIPMRSTYYLDRTHIPAGFVTCDLWDTLIGRDRPAEATKRESALLVSFLDWKNNDYESNRILPTQIHKLRNKIESEIYKQGSQPKVREVLQRTFSQSSIFGVDFNEISDFEVRQEIIHSYPVNSIVDLVSKDIQYVISDHYYSSSDLKNIVTSLISSATRADLEIHSSADYGVTKAMDGKLFSVLIKKELMKDWEHIGDNAWSDIECSRKLGAKPSLVKPVLGSSWNQHEIDVELMAREMSESLSLGELGKYLCDVSTIAYGLVSFAIEEAVSNKVGKVLYLSREGELLTTAHKLLNKHLSKYAIPEIQPIHIPCSRSSMLLASYGPDQIKEALHEISLQYPRMTIKTFTSTMGLSTELSIDVIEGFKFNQSTLHSTKSIYGDLPEVLRERITHEVGENRKRLKSLLSQLDLSNGDYVVCDVGWRGSIQDSIERLIGKRIQGTYLGVRRPLKSGVGNRNKYGLLFDEVRNIPASSIFDFVGPIERAFTISDRQVAGYEEMSDGSIVPTYSQNPEKISDWRIEANEAHFGKVFEAASIKWLSCGVFGIETKQAVEAVLKDWQSKPNIYHCDLWFSEKHGEDFGAGENVHYVIEEPSNKWLGTGGKKEVLRAMRLSAWPSGYIRWISHGLGI
jgi:hypothetical protein